MLTKEDLILGQLIAGGLPPDQAVNPSGIIAGLNEESYGVSPYSSVGFLDQVRDVTSEMTAHSEIMDMATTEMAKVIRGAFDMVKTYGVPMALAIADGVSCLYSQDSIRSTLRYELKTQYVCVDDPLFHLGIYPVQVANKALSFNSVNFGMLGRLQFDCFANLSLMDFVDSKHPEIVKVMKDQGVSDYQVLNSLTTLEGIREIFTIKGNALVDFTETRTIDLPRLMKMFVVISKMYMADKPPVYLTEGSLEDYREFVNLMWNGISRYLINLKDFVKTYRSREIVLVDQGPVRYTSITPNEALGVKVNVVEGKVLVYYTEAIMKTITSSETSISDVVLAYLYARVSGQNFSLRELADDKLKVNNLLSAYLEEVSGVINRAAQKVFCDGAAIAIARFIESQPAAREALYRTVGENGSLVPTLVRNRLGSAISQLYETYNREMTKRDKDLATIDSSEGEYSSSLVGERRKHCIEIILSTDIVPVFLNLLGCDMAASIIAATYVTQDKVFTSVDEREQLHLALIKVLAKLTVE